jgi:hypothetical protein
MLSRILQKDYSCAFAVFAGSFNQQLTAYSPFIYVCIDFFALIFKTVLTLQYSSFPLYNVYSFLWMINAVFRVKGPGLFFIVPCIDTYRYTDHGLINHIDYKAKWCPLKKLTVRDLLCGRCLCVYLSAAPSPYRFLFGVV